MIKYRDLIRPAIADFKHVLMLTLTVERRDSPKDAYEKAQKERAVSELIRALHRNGFLVTKRFFYVIEFHRDGYPHWHVIVESGYIPHAELKKRWGRGHVWISAGPRNKKEAFKSADHAMNYVTKYLTKSEPFPNWVMEYEGNMRRFSTSRGLIREVKPRPKKSPLSQRQKKPRQRRTPKERVSSCGAKTSLLIRYGRDFRFYESIDLKFEERFRKLSHAELRQLVAEQNAQARDQLNHWTSIVRNELATWCHPSTTSHQICSRTEIHLDPKRNRRYRQHVKIVGRKSFVLKRSKQAQKSSRSDYAFGKPCVSCGEFLAGGKSGNEDTRQNSREREE